MLTGRGRTSVESSAPAPPKARWYEFLHELDTKELQQLPELSDDPTTRLAIRKKMRGTP